MSEKHVLPAIQENNQPPVSGRKYFYHHIPSLDEASSSTNAPLSSNQLYIPEEKPFFVENKMFRTYVNHTPTMNNFSLQITDL